jgi:hypothetical protein
MRHTDLSGAMKPALRERISGSLPVHARLAPQISSGLRSTSPARKRADLRPPMARCARREAYALQRAGWTRGPESLAKPYRLARHRYRLAVSLVIHGEPIA